MGIVSIIPSFFQYNGTHPVSFLDERDYSMLYQRRRKCTVIQVCFPIIPSFNFLIFLSLVLIILCHIFSSTGGDEHDSFQYDIWNLKEMNNSNKIHKIIFIK